MDSTIDLPGILAPIPGEKPYGVNLRYEPDYDVIKEARRADDATLPLGVWQSTMKRADWDEVIRLCSRALVERSKDLQIACWLFEALLHKYHFAGLAPGFDVITGLVERYWEKLYPSNGTGDISYRVMPIEWINQKLAVVLNQLPLTAPSESHADGFAWTDYLNARRLGVAAKQDPAVLAKHGDESMAAFTVAVQATPTGFYKSIDRHIRVALEAVERLDAVLDAKCGGDAPSLVGFREGLQSIVVMIETVLHERHEFVDESGDDAPADDPGFDDETDGEDEVVVGAYAGGPIRNRSDAYRRLREVADYLFRVEPHSPTPYLVQRAASWGQLPLHELIIEMTQGRSDLATLFELLGMAEYIKGKR